MRGCFSALFTSVFLGFDAMSYLVPPTMEATASTFDSLRPSQPGTRLHELKHTIIQGTMVIGKTHRVMTLGTPGAGQGL